MFDILTALEAYGTLMTTSDVVAVFSISESTVKRMIVSRKIPSFLIGGQRRFDPAQLSRWLTKLNPKIREGRT